MQLSEIINHYEMFSKWLESLKKINDEQWKGAIAEGKWSVAAVVGHILLWDQYSLKERFPYFKEGAKLSSFPDFQKINDQAVEYANKQVSKDELIDELLAVRKQFLSLLDQMSEDILNTAFSIGDHELTMKAYFLDFVDHDLHHQEQVMKAIHENSKMVEKKWS